MEFIAFCYACFEEQGHLWVLAAVQTFVKHHGSSYMVLFVLNKVRFVQKRDPFCPEAWSGLSWKVVRFVLRCGPVCPKMWPLLSMVRFVRVPG